MKIYDQIAKFKTFTLSDVTAITGNINTSASLVSRLVKKNYVTRIRKDLYTCVDLTTGNVVANKYQIASAINQDAYISHHTAFEFYGLANQVYHIAYVSSKKQFNTFEFKGVTFKHVNSFFEDGVVQVKNIEGIRIADIERALIDSMHHMSKIGGVEELINIIEMIDQLDDSKLLRYMEKYSNKFLYQKAGYFLQNYYKGQGLEKSFFEMCHIQAGNSVRYLMANHEGRFCADWNLVIPEAFLAIIDKEVKPNEYI